MNLGGDWSRNDVVTLWRAALWLPLQHLAENPNLRALRREVAAPLEAEGLAELGAYDAAAREIVLYDKLFVGLARMSCVEVLAQLVGQSLWQAEAHGAAIGDAARWGELYARYILQPERLDGEPELVAQIEELLGGLDGAWRLHELIADELLRRNVVGPGATGPVSFREGPSPLDDAEATAPFCFIEVLQEVGGGAPPLSRCVAIDTSARRVWYREEEGFASFLEAIDFLDEPARLDAEKLLCAWHVLAKGAPLRVAQGPEGRDEAARPLMAAPRVEADGAGGQRIVGWSSADDGWRVERHVIEVLADGTVRATTEPSSDVVRRARGAR